MKGSKTMKSIIKITALVLVLCIAFVGCGKTKTEGKIVIGDYKNLTITNYDTTVTEEDVNEAISAFLSENKQEVEVTDAGAAEGNKVVIDFEGLMDGVAFEGGTATDYTLNSLCYGSFIDGFEESIVGKKAGESFSVDLQFPDPYENNPDFAGKPVTFNITVKSVYDIQIPEYNDDTVNKYAGYNTTADFEEHLKESLKLEKEEMAIINQNDEIWEQLFEISEVTSWPQDEIDTYVADMKAYFEAYAQMFGVTYAEFLATYTSLGTEKEAEEYMLEEAKIMIKGSLIIATLVEENNITYTDAEYNAFVEDYAAANGMTAADVISTYDEAEIAEAVYYEKIMDFLRPLAVQVEPSTAE